MATHSQGTVTRKVMVKKCPITSGCDTKMTMIDFKRTCQSFRDAKNKTAFGGKRRFPICKECKRTVPKEITIVSKQEMYGGTYGLGNRA